MKKLLLILLLCCAVNGEVTQSTDTLKLNSKAIGNAYRWDVNGVQAATTQMYTVEADSTFYANKTKIENHVDGVKAGAWNFTGGNKRSINFK